jgi:ketosteroid isomerase-like protein
MKIRLVIALAGLAISFALPTFAQQTVDPQVAEQIRVWATKFDEAFNKNDASAVADLFAESGVQAFHTTSYGRQKIEKSYAHDFQRWHPNNHMVTIDRLNAVGKDVRAIGRWSQTHVSDINHAPMHEEGYFTWIIVREGDSWKIRKSIFSEKSDPFSTNDG